MIMEGDPISADQTNWQPAGQVRGLFQTEQPIPKEAEAGDPAEKPSIFSDDGGIDQASPSALRPEGDCRPTPSSATASPGSGNTETAARPSQVSPAVPDSVRPTAKRHYVCPRCGQPFDSVVLGTKGCPDGVPRFRVSFFTGAEKARCPACHVVVTFPMTTLRMYLYTIICFGSLSYLLYDIGRGRPIDGFRPIWVGFFAFVVFRDYAMRSRQDVAVAPHAPDPSGKEKQ